MSILIKMDMPESCGDCRFAHDLKWQCIADEQMRECADSADTAGRPGWCPLVRIPPHGDLIDRDELRRGLNKDGVKYNAVIDANISYTPVVIPEEK